MWQTNRHAVLFLLKFKALGTLDRRVHHLRYQGGPKSPPHIFFVLTNLDCFNLVTSLKKLFLSQGSDVAYIGLWPRAIYLFDRQTDRQTDKQVGRHIYSAVLELTDLISLSVGVLSPNYKRTVYAYLKCLTSHKRNIPNTMLRHKAGQEGRGEILLENSSLR